MATREFRSKVDAWLLLVLVAGSIAIVAGIGAAAFSAPGGWALVASIVAGLLGLALILSTLLNTVYRVDGRTLTVVSGPFRWRIPVAEIESVRRTRNPLSSPALSLDRLSIRYSGNRRIMVSPADRRGFLKALGVEEDAGHGA